MTEPTTLMGYNMAKILELMQYKLPNEAYKPHLTKNYLTVIGSAFTQERLTKIFGLYGVGWGLSWHDEDTLHFEKTTKEGKPRYHFIIKKATFWFKFGDWSGSTTGRGPVSDKVTFYVSGGSDNDNLGDAIAGARTRCISDAAKQMLFQAHIYKNVPYSTPEPPPQTEVSDWRITTSMSPTTPPSSPAPEAQAEPDHHPPPQQINGQRAVLVPQQLKAALLGKAKQKSAELQGARATEYATYQVVTAQLNRAIAGLKKFDANRDKDEINDLRHDFLYYVYGHPSSTEVTQADTLSLVDWLADGTADFKAPLNSIALRELGLAIEEIERSKPEERAVATVS